MVARSSNGIVDFCDTCVYNARVAKGQPETPTLTGPEAARVLARLDGRRPRISEHQIRLLASQRCIVPTVHQSSAKGDPALYGPVDVMLLRLFGALVREGLPRWLAKHAIAVEESALRDALTRGYDAVLQVAGLWAQMVHVSHAGEWRYGELAATMRPPKIAVSVELLNVRRGVRKAMDAERERTPTIWAGCRRVVTMQEASA